MDERPQKSRTHQDRSVKDLIDTYNWFKTGFTDIKGKS